MAWRRVRPVRLAVGALLLGFAIGAAWGAPTASADPGTAQVALEQLSPAVPEPGGTLRVRGWVLNSGDTPLDQVTLRLRTSPEPITAFDEAPTTSLVTELAVADRIPASQQQQFTIEVPVDNLGLDQAGPYALSLEAASAGEPVGSVTTYLPWGPQVITPMRLAWLWPLASWPDRDADGVFLSDRLVSEVSPGGRLDELVSTGAGRNVTWVVDPELLQAANAMSSGYQVMRDGKVTIGQNIAAARAWLDSVRGIAETADIHLVPYADIDAASSRRAGMSTDVIRAVTQAPAVASAALGASARNLIAGAYWAPFGRLDQDTATLLSSAGTSLLVLSAPQDSQSPVAAVGTPTGSVTAVLADRRLADLVSLPAQTTQDRILTRQEFLGRTLALSLARPGKAIVVAPESIRWNPDPELLGGLLRGTEVAPWVELVPLDQVLAAPGGALTRQRTVYGGAAKAAELPAPYMARVAAVNRDVGALGEILSDPAPIIGPFAEASLRTQSAAWRTAPKTADQLVSRVRKEIGQTSGLVAVLTSDTITFSGDTGAVPITVSNGLDQPVTVGVVLRGQPSPRLIAEPSEPVTIEPGGTASLEVQTRVVGSGAVSARAQLLTPQGEDFGTPATTMLTSTAYSRAASWVVIAAFVAIAVFVVVGVTRRIHGARSSKGASATVGS